MMCLLAVDSLHDRKGLADDDRLSRVEILVEFEPVTDYSSPPTPEKLMRLPTRQLIKQDMMDKVVKEERAIVPRNGKMLSVECQVEMTNKFGKYSRRYTTFLAVKGKYLLRATCTEFYFKTSEERPIVAPVADEYRVNVAKAMEAMYSFRM